MKTLLAFLAMLPAAYAADPTPTPTPAAAPSAASAAASPAAATSATGTQEALLPAIKGSVQIPQGWFVKEDNQDGVIVYQISREKVVSDSDSFTAGLILSVTTKVPDRAEMKPSAYATELLANSQDDNNPSELQKSTDGPWQIFRSGYKIDADSGSVQVVNYAKANDQSGTLYFVTWQSPVAEEDKLAPVREAILTSLKLDPSF